MKKLWLIMFTILLAGCGGDEFQDLRDFVETSGADMRGKIEPPPEVRPYESFVYVNDDALPNPFMPREKDMRDAGGSGANQPDMDRPKEALEEFSLESLKMVGFLYQNKVGHAVIRAADGKLHRVKAGNYIGTNFGKIVEVIESEIIVKEMVQDSAGVWTERVSSLQLIE